MRSLCAFLQATQDNPTLHLPKEYMAKECRMQQLPAVRSCTVQPENISRLRTGALTKREAYTGDGQ
jgi:hypothetical protein